jgi:hypothetical protein
MASIFFTERLPGISKFKLLRGRQLAQNAQVVGSAVPDLKGGPARGKPRFFKTIKHDEPKRLPRKQALCQVAEGSDYRNVIRPLTGISLAIEAGGQNSEAYEIGKRSIGMQLSAGGAAASTGSASG